MFNINIYNRTSLKLAMNLLSQNICLPVDKNIGKFGNLFFFRFKQNNKKNIYIVYICINFTITNIKKEKNKNKNNLRFFKAKILESYISNYSIVRLFDCSIVRSSVILLLPLFICISIQCELNIMYGCDKFH